MMLTHENVPEEAALSRWAVARPFLLGTLTVFLLGAVTGFVFTVLRDRGSFAAVHAAFLFVLVLLTAASAVWAWRSWRTVAVHDGPLAPRVRRSQRMMIGMSLAGIPLGIAFAMVERGSLLTGSLAAVQAMVLIVMLLVLAPVCWAWHRSIDELESKAFRDGAVVALYAYGFAAPAWWLAWRGGLAPEVDGVVLYLAVMTVSGMAWLWRRTG